MASLTSSILSITQTITSQAVTFTPGTDCSTKWTYEGSIYNALPSGLLVRNALDSMPDATCYPPAFGAYRRAPLSLQVYSPAACPFNWTTPALASTAGTTIAVCCERGFSYTSFYSSANLGNFSRLHLGCISTLSGTTFVPTRGAEDVGTTLVGVVGPLTMWAQPVTVAYQAKDLSLFTTSTPTSTASAQTSSAAIQGSSVNSGSGPGIGVKAGIGAGIGIVGLILIALSVFCLMKRRKRKPAENFPEVFNPAPGFHAVRPGVPSSYYKHELSQSTGLIEKPDTAIYEKDGQSSSRLNPNGGPCMYQQRPAEMQG